MITGEKWKSLIAKWKKVGPVYQTMERSQYRLDFASKKFNLFSGRTVLDIGCNAGIFGLEVLKYSKAYIGVEKNYRFYRQALITRRYSENSKYKVYNMTLKRFTRTKANVFYDAVFCSYVLHQLSDKDMMVFKNIIIPKAEVIIVQTRNADGRSRKGGKPNSDHNSSGLWKIDKLELFLKNNGFIIKTIVPENGKSFLTIGERI